MGAVGDILKDRAASAPHVAKELAKEAERSDFSLDEDSEVGEGF